MRRAGADSLRPHLFLRTHSPVGSRDAGGTGFFVSPTAVLPAPARTPLPATPIMSDTKEIRVFAPATVANVACGYDVLGFAIDAPGDEIVVRAGAKPGLHITAITGDNGKLPKNPAQNTAGVAALDLLKHLGMSDRGIEMEIHKKMPFGSGLGSSAASGEPA